MTRSIRRRYTCEIRGLTQSGLSLIPESAKDLSPIPGGRKESQCRPGTHQHNTNVAAMTFWQENYTFIKEVYDTRWAAWSWWCYLKQRANYWPLFVLRSHQETDGGGFHVAPISKSVPIMAYFLTSKLTERSHHN